MQSCVAPARKYSCMHVVVVCKLLLRQSDRGLSVCGGCGGGGTGLNLETG